MLDRYPGWKPEGEEKENVFTLRQNVPLEDADGFGGNVRAGGRDADVSELALDEGRK